MSKYIVVLFSVLSVASGGIYSAKWSAAGQAPLILRNNPELQGIDSQYALGSAQDESPITKFEEDSEDIYRSVVIPVEESDGKIEHVETLVIPASSQSQKSQIGLEEVDAPQVVSIGSIYESPNTKIEEQSQYKPKRVRSVTLVEESESGAQVKYVEAPETPASTVRTPNQGGSYYQPSNLAYPAVPAHTYYGPGGYPGHLDHHQSTISPINNIPVYQNPIKVPSYQSVAFAQNAPGFELTSASASSNGVGNDPAGSSSVAVAQNYGGVQSTLSLANINGQESAIATSHNDGKQTSSSAQALNLNAYGSGNTLASSHSSPHFQTAASYTGKH